jgi:hypothetical protein
VEGMAGPKSRKPCAPYGDTHLPREGLHHAACTLRGMPLSSGGLISPKPIACPSLQSRLLIS